MNVTISKSNSKLGNIHNVSLTPVKSCVVGVPCIKDCYAQKAYRQYPIVRFTWDKNLILAKNYRNVYFGDIKEYLSTVKVPVFRWHTAGDILDQNYADNMVMIARDFSNTKFLAFTKQYGLNYSNLPSNLSVVLSVWPNWKMPENDLPKAFMQDGNETRIPDDAIECTGHCEGCFVCWDLTNSGKSVYFHKH